jgi:hypothetical protein
MVFVVSFCVHADRTQPPVCKLWLPEATTCRIGGTSHKENIKKLHSEEPKPDHTILRLGRLNVLAISLLNIWFVMGMRISPRAHRSRNLTRASAFGLAYCPFLQEKHQHIMVSQQHLQRWNRISGEWRPNTSCEQWLLTFSHTFFYTSNAMKIFTNEISKKQWQDPVGVEKYQKFLCTNWAEPAQPGDFIHLINCTRSVINYSNS